MTRFIDLRSEVKDPIPPRIRMVDGKRSVTNLCLLGPDKKVVKRDMKNVTGICFHQTACVFGAPKGSKDPDARYKRALSVPCHAVGFLDGVAALTAPLSWYVYHGNAFNEDCIGLELEGHFSGLLDDPKTPRREDLRSSWKGEEPTPLTEVAIQCYRDLTKKIVEEARAAGAPIEWAYAHRQSNGIKHSDPGEGIWKHVVLEYAVPVLGLKTKSAHTRRDGKTIPKEWAPDGVGNY